MRAGDYQQAKALLSQALYTRAEVNQSRPAIDYFLAMTEHHLGNNEAAQLRLDRANEIAELRLRTLQNWRPRLYWRLLRDEAEGLINKSGNIAD